MHKGSHIKRFSGMLQQLRCDGGCALAEHITEHVIKLEVGNGETILGPVFLSGHVGREFDPVAAKVSKLPNVLWRNEAAANEVVLEQVGDPLRVLLIGFLTLDSFDKFWMADYHMAGVFQNVVDWEPILSCGLHADIFTAIG